MDKLSDWDLAPRSAWEAGEGCIVRCFDSAEAALAFLRKPKPKPSRSVAKVQSYRARQRAGLVCLKVVLPENEVADYMVRTGRLTDNQVLDRQRLECAVGEVITDLCARFK
jgi:hypothetical protein